MKKINFSRKAYERVPPLSRLLLTISLKLTCAILSLSLLVQVYAGDFNAYTYELFYTAAELYRLPLGILLVCVIGSVIISDL